MTEQVVVDAKEGSFAASWEKFVEENKLPPEIAEKLRGVYYAGAMGIFDELHIATPMANTPSEINRASLVFQSLHDEVLSFWEDQEIELDLLVVKADNG